MTHGDQPADPAFLTRLGDRLTALRLAIDLGEITTPAEFQKALAEGGEFELNDVRVRQACASVGLETWLP